MSSQGPVAVRLPESYLSFLNGQSEELNQQLNEADRNAKQAFVKVLAYRQMLCARPKKIAALRNTQRLDTYGLYS
jgi:hypothetical protein